MKIFRFLFTITIVLFVSEITNSQSLKGIIRISYSPDHPENTFIPSKNIGGAIDGHFKGDIDKMLTSKNISEMKSAGLKPVSYRLRTELAGEVWHWNPNGKWSDSVNKQGYWISDPVSKVPILLSHGYRLPRRGNTHDQANNDGYSRITDGDTSTFWKSNPYLDSFFTQESNTLHPQWMILDLGKRRSVNAIRINWGNPYAIRYKIDYAKGNDPQYFDPFEPGIWYPFPIHSIDNSKERNGIKKISGKTLRVRFIRISFTESSYTSNQHSNDIRDKSGFAINEIKAGMLDRRGVFHDYVHHSADHQQSVVYVSTTDSWHTSKDLDPNVEQVGVDRFFTDGLTANRPALMPAALLYDTPENVLSLVAYCKAKHYPVTEWEMGEEPEGQLVSPIDYAALYLQLGNKLRSLDDSSRLGGPCFASLSSEEEEDTTTFTEANWTTLFLNYLKSHNSLNLFNFFSFEWYPFDNLCTPSSPQLAAGPYMLSIAMKNIQNILPAHIPMYVTEYGYSAYEGKPEVEIQGGLMYADILGRFLELGGSKNFLYGYEPAFLQQSFNCGYGNNMLFGLNNNSMIHYKTAAFYTTQMITHYWAQPADSLLKVYPAACNIKNGKNQSLVSIYSVRTPSGKWSVMLINKDAHHTINAEIKVENVSDKKIMAWKPTRLIQYNRERYEWKADGVNGHPVRSLSPVIKKIDASSAISLPPFSLTVINE